MTADGGSGAPAIAAGKRPRLARALHRTGLLALGGRMRALWRDDLRILAYHRVRESVAPPGFSFDEDLISASAESFRRQMRWLKRHHNPIRFDELVDRLDRGRRPPPRAVLVTFDDGYDDNHRIAYPILRECGVPAMFFVSTGHIDSGAPFAYDWLVHMLRTTRATSIELPELDATWPLPAGDDARVALAARLLDRLKTLDAAVQAQVVVRFENAYGMPRAAGHADCRPMAWDDLREMARGGMEVGSHGIDHHMLAKLPHARMLEEVEASKRTIEARLGTRVQAISYPVGGHDAYDDDVVAAVQAAGYRIACSYLAGAATADASTRYAMPRLPIERHMDMPWFEAMMALPEIFLYRSRSRTG